MSPRPILVTCAAAVLVLARPAAAQLAPAVDIGTAGSAGADARWSGAALLAPSLRFDHPRLSLDVRGALRAEEGGGWGAGGDVALALFTPSWRGLRVELSTEAERAPGSGDPSAAPWARGGRAGADLRVSLRRGAAGVWAGAGAARSWTAGIARPAGRGDVGGWAQLGALTLSASISATTVGAAVVGARDSSIMVSRQGAHSIVWYDTTVTIRDSADAAATSDFTDARLGLAWLRGRVALDATVGARLRASGAPRTVWGGVSAVVAVAPALAVVAGGGSAPDDPARGRAAARWATLGVRIASIPFSHPGNAGAAPPAVGRPVATGFGIAAAAAARAGRTLYVLVPGARTVELMGDFTHWEPVAMRRVSADRWEATIPIEPGAHRVNLRIDGEDWRAPPGVPAVADDFGGEVGVVTVP